MSNHIRQALSATPSVRQTADRLLPLAAFAAIVWLGTILLPHPLSAQAADATWLGDTDANWATEANWDTIQPTGNTPVFDAAGTSGTTLNNDLASGANIVGMRFNAGAPAYTISGNPISLTGNIANNSGNDQTINLGIDLGNNSSRSVSLSGGGFVVLNGNISGTGTSGISVSGAPSASPAQLVLGGNNSLSGTASTVGDHTSLTLANANALGGISTLSVNSSFFRNYSGSDVTVNGDLAIFNGANMILADTGFTNNLTFTGSLKGGSGNLTQVTRGTLSVASVDRGSLGFSKGGAGTLEIRGASPTYTGGISLGNGTLLLGDRQSLGTGASISFTAGRIAASTDLSGANALPYNVSYSGNSGGFSGANNLEIGGTLTVAFGGFIEMFNDLSSGATLTLNDIAINGANKRFYIWGSGDTKVAGTINETNGNTGASLWKQGTGTLTLTGINAYDAETRVYEGGMLRLEHVGAIPGGIGASGGTSWLFVTGGSVLGLGADNFYRALGTGTEQVQFSGSGGFAAYNADRMVNLGGASAPLTWASGNFVSTTLILGAADATHTLDFQNPIAFGNNATRTVQVNNGAAAVDGILSGALSGTGSSGLTKTGDGTLFLNADNTYPGATTVNAGRIGGNGSIAGNLVMNGGGFAARVGHCLDVAGDVDLSAADDSIVVVGAKPTERIVILTYTGTLTGTFDNTEGLPVNCLMDYSVPGEIAIKPPPRGTVVIIR